MNPVSVSAAIRQFALEHRTTFNFLNNRQTQLLEVGGVVGVVQHYRANGYSTEILNPIGTSDFRVKLSTRGHPADYSRVLCVRGEESCELHTNLSVLGGRGGVYCVDVAIVKTGIVPVSKGRAPLPAMENTSLISFAECKKLVVYPMLLAQFIGIVHEITPQFLKRHKKFALQNGHLHPTLIALGNLTPNAREIVENFRRRKYKICVAPSFDVRLAAIVNRRTKSPFSSFEEILKPEPQPDAVAGETLS